MGEDSPIETMSPVNEPYRDGAGSFEEFYLGELPRLTALARCLASAAVAEDLAQEAMLAAYRRWHEVRDLQRPDLWVRRTCSNMAISHVRRRMVELRVTARLASRREPLAPLSEPVEEFWAAVRQLPARQGQAAALRYVYDMPIADIAETMGCSVGSVKSHLSRARMTLAAALGTDGEESR